jgi:galactonate dehydratase
MRITSVRAIVVGNPWKNWVFVRVATDEGLAGLGEATGGIAAKSHVGDVEELSQFVVGQDPLNPECLWTKMYKDRFLRPCPAMSGIEMACWDIAAKSLNAPLYALLGGKHRNSLRAYANGWYRGPRDPHFFADRASDLVEQGYTALKFDPFGGAYGTMDSREEQRSLDIIRSVRSAVGRDVDILIEGHDRFTVSYATRVASRIAEFDPLFFETPVLSTDLAGIAEVARRSPVPIAVGERFDSLAQFAELSRHRCVDIYQPEVIRMGLANFKKVCALAEATNARIAGHQAQSPLCTAVNTHLHASIPNFLIQESFDDFLEPWTWEVISGTPRVRNGYVPVPSTPGIGIDIDEEKAKKHPYSERNFLSLFKEGWETRT